MTHEEVTNLKMKSKSKSTAELREAERKSTKILSWVDIDLEEAERLYQVNAADCIALLRKKVESIVALSNGDENDVRRNILADMFFYAIRLSKDNQFTPEQCSILFTLLRLTHEEAIKNPHSTLNGVFSCFREMLERHNVQRPPFSEAVFTLDQTATILDFALKTYFRHFKLYKYAFTNQQYLSVKLGYSDADREAAEEAAAAVGGGTDLSEIDEDAMGGGEAVVDGASGDALSQPAASGLEKDEVQSLHNQPACLETEDGQRLKEYIMEMLEAKKRELLGAEEKIDVAAPNG